MANKDNSQKSGNDGKNAVRAVVEYPQEVLRPVKEYLVQKLKGLEKRKKDLDVEDPYSDKSRVNDNAAIDADAAETVGHMTTSALKHTVDRSIIQIRKAMSQIKIGRYGVCESCGKMIDTDRLMIMPETTLCIDCEKQREK